MRRGIEPEFLRDRQMSQISRKSSRNLGNNNFSQTVKEFSKSPLFSEKKPPKTTGLFGPVLD